MLGPFGQVHGSTSYTAQDPWIQNCSLQDNVLMGLPLDSALYDSVLQACALLPDLGLLPAGDQTEIGEAQHTSKFHCSDLRAMAYGHSSGLPP